MGRKWRRGGKNMRGIEDKAGRERKRKCAFPLGQSTGEVCREGPGGWDK